ncbi:protein kinase [Sulfurovum sp. bin170]|uniref:protein kinase domain-containing protein n=1 Tax=Sulfurovum sp. bin170 TaxID=2695268 RepID=UPI0013DEBDD1|nr:protein kinase [Sulfurovum sp. bin170]NEW60698.1 protein kinase [Sulfurovum sp. bin170]
MQKKIISNTLHIGTQLDGYEIEKVLGQGGFGIVYRAKNLQNHNLVAIKEFFPSTLSIMRTDDQTQITANSQEDLDSFEVGLEKFRKEATALSQFQHPNIVQIIDYIRAFGTEYFVMPYERGMTLADYIKTYGSFPSEEIINLLVPILNGLDMMHQYNIFHRDIKPDNIFLREDGMPMLIDFGAARQAIGEKSQDFTQILTHGYAPPEQYETKASNQGAWSDFYALGATFYSVMTGERPPPASDRINALVGHGSDPIVYPRGEYDTTLLNSLMKAMMIRREERFQTVDEWFEFLFSDSGDGEEKREDGVLPKGFILNINSNSYIEIIECLEKNSSENRYKAKYIFETQRDCLFNEFYPRALINDRDRDFFEEITEIYREYLLFSACKQNIEWLPRPYLSQSGIVGNFQLLDDDTLTLKEYMRYVTDTTTLDEDGVINIGLETLHYLHNCGDDSFLHLGISLDSILIGKERMLLAHTGWAEYCDLLILNYQYKNISITQPERDYNYILADKYIDSSSDIYALGVVLYRLMIGIDIKLENYITRLNSFLENDVDLYVRPYGYSSELTAVVMRAIAIDQRDRIASIDEFMNVLKKI